MCWRLDTWMSQCSARALEYGLAFGRVRRYNMLRPDSALEMSGNAI